jgi:K+-transporting ATPase KdpF subunit
MPAGDCELMENIIVGIISVALIVYLFWTLIRPESF